MIEYGNTIHREDIYFSDSNYIGREIVRVKTIDNLSRKRKIIHDTSMTLLDEALDKNEGKVHIYEQDGMTLLIAEFDYNSKIYYWWEIYNGVMDERVRDRIKSIDLRLEESGKGLAVMWDSDELLPMNSLNKSTLELVLMKNPLTTYVLFSTDEHQIPMIDNYKRMGYL